MDTCRSCNADIIWTKTVAGNVMPVDAQPVPTGNLALVDGVSHVIKDTLFDEVHNGPRYQSHFVSCPNAQKHRKGRK